MSHHCVSVLGLAEPPDSDIHSRQLEREGVRSFCDSYHQLLACIETKLQPALHS